MFHAGELHGDALPEGTLCLTYDDGPDATAAAAGPGPRTRELASYLAEEAVAATFFVVGRQVARHPELLAHLVAAGQTVGNHTYDHPSLPSFAAKGGDPVQQVARTAELIGPYAGDVVYFRPPYGAWEAGLADRLNASGLGDRHVGPVHYDIAPGDWWFWQHGASLSECLAAHLAAIARQRRGILLLHDSTADQPATRAANRTLELTRRLVPALKAQGYRFVSLAAALGGSR